MEDPPLSTAQKDFFTNLKKYSELNNLKSINTITVKQISEELQKWKEQPSTSPSLRHLGHYKCLLILDNNNVDTIIKNFNTTMLSILYTMINAALVIGSLLERWTNSGVIMISKKRQQ